MLRQRILTAAVLLPLFGAALFLLPDLLWAALVSVVVALGGWEWARMARDVPALGYALATGALAFVLYLAVAGGGAGAHAMRIAVYGAAVVFWLLCAAWILPSGALPSGALGTAATGWIILLPAALAATDLRVPEPSLLLLLLSVIWVADTAAYFSGRSFGRHKLAPRISPGKTWEGVAGALGAVALLGVAAGRWGPLAERLPGATWGKTAVVAALLFCAITMVSIVGDLLESAFKRRAGVKDSGALLPGHGGVLDRIDSVTAALPCAALALALLPGLSS